jgi:hypothetical protein
MGYGVFMNCKQISNPTELLSKYNKLQQASKSLRMKSRAILFEKKANSIRDQVHIMAAMHGFECIVIMAGASVNSDGGLASFIETPGAKGVRDLFHIANVALTMRLSQVLARQYGIEDDFIFSGFKTHI